MSSFGHSETDASFSLLFVREEDLIYVGWSMSENISTLRCKEEFLSHSLEIKFFQIFIIFVQQWKFQMNNISLGGVVCNFYSIGIYWNVNGYPI